MKATLSTRKPIDEITIEDLRSFPVWEFASDEEGATSIKTRLGFDPFGRKLFAPVSIRSLSPRHLA